MKLRDLIEAKKIDFDAVTKRLSKTLGLPSNVKWIKDGITEGYMIFEPDHGGKWKYGSKTTCVENAYDAVAEGEQDGLRGLDCLDRLEKAGKAELDKMKEEGLITYHDFVWDHADSGNVAKKYVDRDDPPKVAFFIELD